MHPTQAEQLLSIGETLALAEAYLAGFGIPEARRDAELLMEQILGSGRTEVYLAYKKPLWDAAAYWSLVKRRSKREPMGYITGLQGFWSVDLHVEPGVFIPRRETEHLIEEALGIIRSRSEPKILEIGTGSGAIAISLARERADSRLWATDISPKALGIACRNARASSVDHQLALFCGDLFEPMRRMEVELDLVVSNPPYIAAPEWDALEEEVRLWEPELALLGGEDGLRFYPDLLKGALRLLHPKGSLVLEVGANQADRVARMVGEVGGYHAAMVTKDYSGRDRVVVAHRARNRG